MSHHASGPNFGFPRGDARLDMTDFYVFTKPGDPEKSTWIDHTSTQKTVRGMKIPGGNSFGNSD